METEPDSGYLSVRFTHPMVHPILMCMPCVATRYDGDKAAAKDWIEETFKPARGEANSTLQYRVYIR